MSYRTKEMLIALFINAMLTLLLGNFLEQGAYRILFMEGVMLFLNLIIYLACLPNRGEVLPFREEVKLFFYYLSQSRWALIILVTMVILYATIAPDWSFSLYFLTHYLFLFFNFGAIRSVMNVPIKFNEDDDNNVMRKQ